MANLFKKIFWKNFNKTTPEKLADDLDPALLKGYFQYKQYDPITGKILGISEKQNTLVNQSKTNLIRLISQGQSNWVGQIDPSKLKITKMRFGNNDPGSGSIPDKRLYYLISEPSARESHPINNVYAGGLEAATQILADPNSQIVYSISNVPGNYVVGSNPNIKIWVIRIQSSGGPALSDMPPSHGTYKVELLLSGSVVETIYFYNPASPSDSIYTRGPKNPYKVITVGLNSNTRVMGPDQRTTVGGNQELDILPEHNSKTFLYWDYGTNQWKLQLEEISGAGVRYDTLRMTYERGLYNVVNSIIPRDGYNVGSGDSLSLRYANNTAGDSYPVLSTIEYRDGDTDFVDDYSVTFSINMSAQYGNGTITNMAHYIKYKEAYLFNDLDQLFSGLFLTNSFDKNPLTAFYISWTILSPLV